MNHSQLVTNYTFEQVGITQSYKKIYIFNTEDMKKKE